MLTFFKNISLYSLGGVINKSIQFLLLPLYAHYLSPEDYGKLELTYLYGAVLVIFYGFLIENGYSRIFFDRNDVNFRDSLFGTSLLFKIFTGIFFLAVSFAFSKDIASLLFDFDNGDYYIRLISISIFVNSLSEIPLKTLIMEKRAGRYVINNLVYVLVSILLTVYFIVVLKLNIAGVLYGQMLGAAVQFITLLITEWKWSYLQFSFKYLKSMFYFSLFLIPSQLSSFVTYWSNRLFLQEYTSLDDVGTFSFGYKIASIIPVLLTGPIKKAVGPEIYELIDRPEECRKRIRQFTLITLLILTLSALALSIFSKELIMLMAAKAYSSSYEVVFILSMGYVIIGMAGIVVLPIQITKKTWLITITWVLSSVVNVALNYWLVPSYGKAGATYATLLTFVFILGLYFLSGEQVYNVKFEYGKYALILLIGCISYFVAMWIQTGLIVLDILLKSTLLILIAFLLVRLVISQNDRRRIRKLLSSKFPFHLI